MSDSDSGWTANSARQDGDLAPLAPLAAGTETAGRDLHGRFVTGNNGGGRPKGSRNRLTDAIVSIISDDFATNGRSAVEALRQRDPLSYLRLVVSLVPQRLLFEKEEYIDYSQYSYEEIDKIVKKEQQNAHMNRAIASIRNI